MTTRTLQSGDARLVNEASQLMAKAQAKLSKIDKRRYRSAPDIKKMLAEAQADASEDAMALASLANR